ncbi:MAG: peptidoglycan-binding protein LysM [Flavobacteriales bacterium]|nr:MAG: peptidoglycan-binding protein LysM [Flavobacteriales bacterium]PIE48530.1 MAG: peptidoglycan-binding protein LysM [Flavobacteriales bacterium]
MGLFSFIKNAGAKVFGIGKTEEAEAAENAAKAAELAKIKEGKLVAAISALQLNVKNLNIEVNGDKAAVTGEAKNQSTREKVVLVIGNTEGISTVDDQMTTAVQEPEAQFYTVEKGDSLSKIAKKYYGNAMKYPVIFEANKPMLTHPDKIYPGQVLRIPKDKS